MSGPFNLNNPNITFVHSHPLASGSLPGFMSSADKTKLDGISPGATANSTDAQLRDRATHTGTQAISTITGLQTALDGKQATSTLLDNIAALGAGTGILRKTGATTWTLDGANYLTGNQTITVSGDATGSGSTSIALTLANSGVTAGTYRSVTVDVKGRVTAGTNPTTLAGYGITDAQPLDATLTALAGLVTSADRFIFFTGTDVASLGTITSFGRSLIDDADAATARTTLGLGSAATQNATAFQAADADLTAIAALADTSGLLRKTAADTWSLDTAAYLTGNQTITVTGDVTGSGTTALTLTLANSGVTAGTYQSVTVDAKGRVTNGAALSAGNIPNLPASILTSGTVDVARLPVGTTAAVGVVQLSSSTSSTSTTLAATPSAVKAAYDLAAAAIPLSEKGVANGVATLDANGFIPTNQLPSYVDDVLEFATQANFPGTGEAGKLYLALDTTKLFRWTGSVYVSISDAASTADTAVSLQTARTISATGDATWSVSFNGTANVSSALTLANSGVIAGTYRSVTVDAKGRVTAGTNPTTLSGYGITDAQPLDATLTAVAGVTTAANTIVYFTGVDTATSTPLTAFGRSLIDDADATAARTTLGLGSAATQNTSAFQAADADLTAIAALAGTSGLLRKTAADTWSLDTSAYLTANQSITVTGDATGSGTTSIALTLANTGVTGGTYRSVSVDAKGRVTAGTNPTTLSGYGITDAQPLNTGLTAFSTQYNSAGVVDGTFIFYGSGGTASRMVSNSFGRSLLAADYATARTLLGVDSVASGLGDNDILSNLDIKRISRLRSSAAISLDFLKSEFRANTRGLGLESFSVSDILMCARSDIKAAVIGARPVDDGIPTFNSVLGVLSGIDSTNIPPVATVYAPATHAVGGAYRYVGEWGHRIEHKMSDTLRGYVTVDGDTTVVGGLLVEPRSVNIFSNVTASTQTNVTAGATGLSPFGGGIVAPSDLYDTLRVSPIGVEIVETTANGRHFSQNNTIATVTSGQQYTWSTYVNVANATSFFIELGNAFPTQANCSFTKSTTNGDIILEGTPGADCLRFSIEAITGAWFRVSMTAQATSSNVAHLRIGTGAASASYIGNVQTRIVVWGRQFENTSFVTSYIHPLNTTRNARGTDVIRMNVASSGSISANDDFASYRPLGSQQAASASQWIVMHIDSLKFVTYDHMLMSITSAFNGLDPWLRVEAQIQSATQMTLKLTADPGTLVTDSLVVNFRHNKPFTIAVRVDASKNIVQLLAHQQGATDSSATLLTLPNSLTITDQCEVLHIGSAPYIGTTPTSSYINPTMWGHIRNVEIYQSNINIEDMSLILKTYHLV